ncbi:helix-turn-helix domain-containing protein [Aminipila terrae]|uniref:Helix-turn-helix domain-containing protein n=1 Tax=Aminipila terrae TaxID=2697030 RepID=A0A6P1MJ97_9FIRM|nr:helix-turn-helix transcriptional regulator [Aminipila terrae]QHI73811.1 helix-turn-helix domain-containing protein [Aminipila terrae]
MRTLEKILYLIKLNGFSNAEFARQADFPRNIINEWQNGKLKSYNKHLPKIAEVLGVDVEELMDDPEEETPFSSFVLADNLEKISESKGYTMDRLIADLNLKPDIVKKMKKGINPTVETIKLFSEKLGVSYGVLYGIEDPESDNKVDYDSILITDDYNLLIERKSNKEINADIYRKLLYYFYRLKEEDQDYILGQMIQLYNISKE